MCQHTTCANIVKKTNGKAKAASVAFVLNYRFPNGDKQWVIALGKEDFGKYQNQFNLCCGSLDKQDNGCFIACAIRELREEFKINLSWKDFDKHFIAPNGHIRYILHYDSHTHTYTPIFIGRFDGYHRDPIKNMMKECKKNPNTPSCEKEMSDFEYFFLNGQQIQGFPCQISDFARAVARKIDTKFL